MWVNAIGNAVRLALPFALLAMGALAAYLASAVSWFVAAAIFAVLLVRKHGHRFRIEVDRASIRTMGRFSAGSYLSNIVGSLPITLLPVIVLTRLGPEASAFWYIAITIAMLLYSLPSVVSQSLMVEGAHRPSERLRLVRHSAAGIAIVMLPAIAVVFAAAPLLLSVFGNEYVAGSVTAVRLLALSAVMVSINYVTGTVLYLAKRVFIITFINVVDAIIVLGLTLTVAHSVTGVAMAWFIGEIFNVVLFAIAAVTAVRRSPEEWHGDVAEEMTRVP
jgi:O-antigen/teichoic acid export membrane protein